MLGNGISRIRGNKTGGVQTLNTWSTVIIATGEETISTTNSTTGIQTRCLEIEGSPFDNDEDKASSMYGIIAEQYGTAGPYYINKLIDEYSKDDYKQLKEKYQEVLKKIKETTNNDISSYVSSVAITTLGDILIGKWLFDEGEEKSFEMANEILNNLDRAKEIDVVDKCYEYISSWLIANHKKFDNYIENPTREDDDLRTNRDTASSFGLYDKKCYYVFRNVLEDKLKSQGYSYRKITQEFAKRGYITPTLNEDGTIQNTTQQKKYRGKNIRFFVFPSENIGKEVTNEERIQQIKDTQAQCRGFKDNSEMEEYQSEVKVCMIDLGTRQKANKELAQLLKLPEKEETEEIEGFYLPKINPEDINLEKENKIDEEVIKMRDELEKKDLS